MKKITLTLACLTVSFYSFSQDPWRTNLNDVFPGQQSQLGTSTNAPLIFSTNNMQRMSLSGDGVLNLSKFASNDPNAESSLRPLAVDQYGNVAIPDGINYTTAGGGTVYNCLTTTPWYMGGNKNTGIANTIGTCDDKDFILKANDVKLMSIKSVTAANGPYAIGVGPNNLNPVGLMDISDGSVNSTYQTPNSMRIYGDAAGTIEAFFTPMNLLGDGLNFGLGTKGSSSTVFSIDGGGDAHMQNTHMMNANMLDAHMQNAYTANINMVGKLNMKNSGNATTYDLAVDATGIGNISSGTLRFLNFKAGGSPAYPQVWIGTKKPTTPHNDFSFAVEGKAVMQSLYVTSVLNWADYVFAADYKLPKLAEVERFYKENQHLPEVPNAQEVNEKGIDVAQMNTLLLKKIEELTLYAVDQDKKYQQQQKQLVQLQKQISDLQK